MNTKLSETELAAVIEQNLETLPTRRDGRKFELLGSEEGELAVLLREHVVMLKQARVEIKTTRNLIDRLELELREKTAALRALQDERDPNVIARRVAEAVDNATQDLKEDAKNYRARLAVAERELEELRASKRKLREALERAKERR